MVAPLKVGLAGLGTVGASVVQLIARQREALTARCGRPIEVVAVCARSRSRQRDVDLGAMRWVDDPVGLAADPGIHVFVELIGGEGDPAKAAIERALASGKSVVTANKALLARHGVALAALAEQHHVALNFEAAVAGGIPIIKTLREGLVGNSLERIYGILNGTCNYILTRMEREKLSFADCLKDAQRLGYAEADPTFDIGGFDTAHKLAILTSLAFGSEVDAEAVHVEGIESITLADLDAADELGYRVKLLGVAQRTDAGIEQRVHPTMVRKGSVVAGVNGVTNAVAIDADTMELTLIGPGAGGAATASSVVSDLIDLAAERRMPAFGRPAAGMSKPARAPMQRHEGGYYIRLSAVDRPGTVAAIATRLAEQNISLESIVQRHRGTHGGEDPNTSAGPVPVILITYATTEAAVRKALSAVESDGAIAEPPQLIRIEKHR
jgi:homoserine dehydrogenase